MDSLTAEKELFQVHVKSLAIQAFPLINTSGHSMFVVFQEQIAVEKLFESTFV